jgi:hypothetical protein
VHNPALGQKQVSSGCRGAEPESCCFPARGAPSRPCSMDADLHFEAVSALRAGMLLTKEQMAALRAAAYPLLTPKREPNRSIIVTPQKRSRLG